MVTVNTTVAEYASAWLPANRPNVRRATYNTYAHYLEQFCEMYGTIPIRAVTPSMVKAFYTACFSGKKSGTISKAKALYASMFDSAMYDGLCRTNPAKAKTAQPHKAESGTHRNITDEERQLIHTVPHRMQTAAMVMLYAGLRRGECAAATIEDSVDFTTDTIHIRKAVHLEGNTPVIEAHGKTAAAIRDIPLFAPLRAYLIGKAGLLMPSAEGTLCTNGAMRHGWDSYMKALSAAAGHPVKIRMHDLRHSFATMLCDAGVDLHTAMTWMGHADQTMLLKIYDHVTETRIKREAEKVTFFMNGCQNGCQQPLHIVNK